MKRTTGLTLATLLFGTISLGAMAHGGADNQGQGNRSGMGMGMGNGAGMGQGMMQQGAQGGYGNFGRMQMLMQQMHRTDDMESHYQLMLQHWQEMEKAMAQLQDNPAQSATPDQLRQRDDTMRQLQEQMRLHRQEFDRLDYGRGMMRQ